MFKHTQTDEKEEDCWSISQCHWWEHQTLVI